MSYSIETRTVTEFVTDSNIRLPRFQRKSTWGPSQNFELAISMFKEYPLGVIVINDEKGTSWLLDGRQRRNALKELRDNPDKVYDAARSYIKFKSTESEDIIKRSFWKVVDSYLLDENKAYEIDTLAEDTTDDFQCDINRERQREGLDVLLDIILMVHQKKKDKESGRMYGKWERLFKLDKYLSNLSYATKRDNFCISPEQLHSFLLMVAQKAKDDKRELTASFFIELMDENIKDGKEAEFRDYIQKNWSDISKVIDVIRRSEEIFRRARIGVISIKNVTPLDAQNIFSVINSGGTPLTPEELISAKPFWNEPVDGCSKELVGLVNQLYTRLDVTAPGDGRVVRWDLVATLMSRVRDNNLFFEDYKALANVTDSKSLKFPEISIGFKFLSSWFMKGVSKVHIGAIEQSRSIVWPQSIDEFIEDFNRMCAVLLKDDFFQSLNHWQRPFTKLFGTGATFDFCVIILKDWQDLGEPVHPGAELNKFYRHARSLFDNLAFEYATGFWKGSGDSKMAKHINKPDDRIVPLDSKIWMPLIKELCEKGKYNGQNIGRTNIEPLIYYLMVIRNCHHPLDNLKYEIDHIIPQALIKDNTVVPEWFMDSPVNLSLLPKQSNNSKKALLLSDLKDDILGHTVSRFTGLDINDFPTYSNISNLEALISRRSELWITTFGKDREQALNK